MRSLLDMSFEHENLEAFDDAIQCLLRAAEIDPENDAVLYRLAYCYDLAGRNNESIVYFREFTDKYPYAFVAWYNLGNALAIAERIDESNEALELSIAIDERFTSAYFSKARNLLVSGRYEEAIACYRETQTYEGPQAITFSYIGECYEKMERYNEALIHYDQALALDPNWTDAWIGRGVVKDLRARPRRPSRTWRSPRAYSPTILTLGTIWPTRWAGPHSTSARRRPTPS